MVQGACRWYEHGAYVPAINKGRVKKGILPLVKNTLRKVYKIFLITVLSFGQNVVAVPHLATKESGKSLYSGQPSTWRSSGKKEGTDIVGQLEVWALFFTSHFMHTVLRNIIHL